MTRWSPSSEMWKGQDAYVIGGGPSLRTFDWDLLRGQNTVGCNGAYMLGADVCKIVVFADYQWWLNIGAKSLPDYGGIVVACSPRLETGPWKTPPWLLSMDRIENGLSLTGLGFNGNSGSLAVNLCLLLGARRVFLLGFDMKLGDDKRVNWHDERYQAGNAGHYARFKRAFTQVARDLPTMFPGREVINVSDVSELGVFPKVSLVDHFGGRYAARAG